MKTQVICGIQTDNFLDLQTKLNLASNFTDIVHIDIADGQFVSTKTIGYLDLKKVKTDVNFNLHLMLKLSNDLIQKYARSSVQTLIIYPQESENVGGSIANIKKNNKKVGMAFDPETDPEKFAHHLSKIDLVLVMTVKSGYAGQKFIASVLPKIEKIKQINPKLKVGVDGGIKVGTAHLSAKAGADFVVANTAIWQADVEPKEAYQRLVKDVENV